MSELALLQPVGFPPLPMDWKTHTGFFPSADGKNQLFYRLHSRQNVQRGRAVIVLHGMGEHSGRYQHLPFFLSPSVDAVFLYDHVGHGHSTGPRGHVWEFDQLTRDSQQAVALANQEISKFLDQSLELHLIAHSLGGHVAARLLMQNPDLQLMSTTLSAMFLGIKIPVPKIKIWAAYLLNYIWPTLGLPTGLDPAKLSHDPEVVKAFAEDRLTHDKMTPRFFMQLLAAFESTLKSQDLMNSAVQFLVPMSDQIVDAKKTLDFAQRLIARSPKNQASREISIQELPGFYHEPMNELDQQQVFDQINGWILKHSKL